MKEDTDILHDGLMTVEQRVVVMTMYATISSDQHLFEMEFVRN